MESRTENRYINNVKEIAKLANERGVDWFVVVDIWDQKIGIMTMNEPNRTELRHEFYNYVSGRRYDENGDEV